MQAAPGDCLCPSSYTCLASPGPSCAHLHLPDSSGGWVHRLEDPAGPSSLRGESPWPTLPRPLPPIPPRAVLGRALGESLSSQRMGSGHSPETTRSRGALGHDSR